jgi:hypothetical protein
MKRLTLLLFVVLALSASAQRKIGLIVAIGEYPELSGWKNLSSINDIKYIKTSLLLNGFTEKDIDTLLNQKATKANILKALDKLYEIAGLGDIVVFHFSGHGQQIFDDENGDEADGYDEALIPYDAGSRWSPTGYKGENHLRDDELGKKLTLIRNKIGANGSLVVLLDACHSGTGTRDAGAFASRGTPVPFKYAGYEPKIKISFASNAPEADEFMSGMSGGLGNMIVISASKPNQVNFETKDNNNIGVGSLSFAFAKAITELKPRSTYALLYEKIKANIQAKFPTQVPLIEGNVTQIVFSNQFISPESYIAIQGWINDSTFSINEGMLSSISRGAKLKVYALNDKDETTPLAEGYISLVGTFQSIGVLSKAVKKGEAYKVKIEETNYGDFSASLLFRTKDEKAKGTLIKQMTKFIEPYQYLSISKTPDFIFDVEVSKTNHIITLIDRTDSTRWIMNVKKGDTLSAAALKDMLDNLKRAMRVNYLRTMPDGGNLTQGVIVEIIPKVSVVMGADFTLKPKDMFTIKITNNSPNDLYYTLVDLMPDNEVKVLIPTEGTSAQDFVIPSKGQPVIIEDVEIDDNTPQGTEFMKFIFTRNAMDLRSVLNRTRSSTRGAGETKGIESVLDDMFKDGNDKMATRANIRSIKIDEVGVITKSINIHR